MQLNLKDAFSCKFVYLYLYKYILYYVLFSLKSPGINLLKSLSNPTGIYFLEVKNWKHQKIKMRGICSNFRGLFIEPSRIF